MNLLWDIANFWPARVVLAAGVVLLFGRLTMALLRQPSRRVVVGTTAILAALSVIPLCLLPGWLPVPSPEIAVESIVRPATVPVEPALETVATEGLVWVMPDIATVGNDANGHSPAESVSALVPHVSDAKSDRPVQPRIAVSSVALCAYCLISVGLLVRLIVGHIGLIRLWSAAHRAPEWVEQLFRRMANEVCPQAQLRITGRAAGPICFGVLRPRIVIPSGLLLAGDGPVLRAILAHELGHLHRHDPLVGWLLGLARAIYFVWPWLAGLRREVRVAQEHLADADAARTTGPADYAELLIRLTRARPAPLGAAGVRGPSSELYRRVTMLLKPSGNVESHCPRRWAIAIVGGLTALAIAVAGLYLPTRTADATEPQRKEAEEKPAPKPPAGRDNLKDTIDKLLKDAGDDPEARKQIEELLKSLGQGKPTPGTVPAVPPAPPALPAPPVLPLRPGVVGRPDLNQELDQAQEMMRRYMEAMADQMKALQGRRGIAIGANAGPIGRFGGNPFGPGGSSARLGIRVERPSDVLASQLDLPNGQGLVCLDVPADSPAGKAGIKPNDILLEVAGKPVSNNQDEFVKALKDVKPDTAVDIVVLRKGKKETMKGAKLPEAKEPPLIQDPFGGVPGVRVLPGGIAGFPGELIAPQLPVPPGERGALRGIGVIAGPGESVRVEQVNDAFTVFYSKNGVKVTVTGSKEGEGEAIAESIEVEEAGKTIKAESIEKLPKEYQELAKAALKAIK